MYAEREREERLAAGGRLLEKQDMKGRVMENKGRRKGRMR